MELFVGRCISLEEKLRDGESLDGTLCAVVVARRSYSDPRTDLGVRWTALSDRDSEPTRPPAAGAHRLSSQRLRNAPKSKRRPLGAADATADSAQEVNAGCGGLQPTIFAIGRKRDSAIGRVGRMVFAGSGPARVASSNLVERATLEHDIGPEYSRLYE